MHVNVHISDFKVKSEQERCAVTVTFVLGAMFFLLNMVAVIAFCNESIKVVNLYEGSSGVILKPGEIKNLEEKITQVSNDMSTLTQSLSVLNEVSAELNADKLQAQHKVNKQGTSGEVVEDWTLKEKESEIVLFEANRVCDHVNSHRHERVQFLDTAHVIYGSADSAVEVPTCRALKPFVNQSDANLNKRILTLYTKCLQCPSSETWWSSKGGPISQEERDESLGKLLAIKDEYEKKHSLNRLTREALDHIVESRSEGQTLVKKMKGKVPVIAVVMGVCSRGMDIYQEGFSLSKDFVLLAKGFQGYAATLEKGFEYWFILVADERDGIFDLAEHQDVVRQRFVETVGLAAKQLETSATLLIFTFRNYARKPGPAFNVGMSIAYADGADYFYRVNDDIVPSNPWAVRLTGVLRSNYPPDFGVVSPDIQVEGFGNDDILAVDFVSRVHFEIFGIYYPSVLADWCMDDWMSRVYGNHHTCRHRVVRARHFMHGTRYEVDKTVHCLLDLEYFYGDQAIHAWMARKGYKFHHGTYADSKQILKDMSKRGFKKVAANPANTAN